jgi:hypothetical protein
MPLALPALMTLLAVLWYIVTALQVARAHGKYNVLPPAMTGHPALERPVRALG